MTLKSGEGERKERENKHHPDSAFLGIINVVQNVEHAKDIEKIINYFMVYKEMYRHG